VNTLRTVLPVLGMARTNKSSAFLNISVVAGLFVSLSANAAFIGVLPETPDGTDWQAYYDDQLDITWTADASINGGATWDGQVAWVAGLSISGVSGWRLPNMDVNDDDLLASCATDTQAQCMDNEYGHLYYYGAGTTLGSGVTVANQNPFSDIGLTLNSQYWSSTETPINAGAAAHFNMGNGTQSFLTKLSGGPAWAVHDGNVGVIPIPGAVWLFGSALGLLGWMRRKAA
jgi:hypothetical protein